MMRQMGLVGVTLVGNVSDTIDLLIMHAVIMHKFLLHSVDLYSHNAYSLLICITRWVPTICIMSKSTVHLLCLR